MKMMIRKVIKCSTTCVPHLVRQGAEDSETRHVFHQGTYNTSSRLVQSWGVIHPLPGMQSCSLIALHPSYFLLLLLLYLPITLAIIVNFTLHPFGPLLCLMCEVRLGEYCVVVVS